MIIKCPICQKQFQENWRPFCSKQCKEIDLGRWFLGNYSIPTEETIDTHDQIYDDS
ncbi:MAG: DNA gyrase inhibitor YacG [Janthinobacterium lividum]